MEIIYPTNFLNFIDEDNQRHETMKKNNSSTHSKQADIDTTKASNGKFPRAYRNCLLSPEDSVILIIDEQPQMFFGVEGKCRLNVMNSVVGLAKTGKIFDVPVILSTVAEKDFSGPIYPKLQKVFPNQVPINRSTLNAWEDERVKNAIKKTGRKKIIIAGLWTEVCVALPTLSAICDGYEVFVVTDACAGSSKEAHDMAINRMTQACAKMITWEAVLLEFQRDWNNKDTYDAVTNLVIEHGGIYGMGIEYVHAMFKNCK